METNTAPPAAPASPNGRLAAIVLLIVIALGLFGVLHLYRSETEKSAASITAGDGESADRIEIFAKVVGVDPIKGDLTCRLDFTPHGAFTPDEGRTLAKPLRLTVNSATGKGEHEFAKGKKMGPVEVVLDLYDSQVMDYPFDAHKADLYLDFELDQAAIDKEKKEKDKEKGAKAEVAPAPAPEVAAEAAEEGDTAEVETAKAEPAKVDPAKPAAAKPEEDGESIPIDFELTGQIAGLKIVGVEDKESTPDFLMIGLTVRRSTTVVGYALFVMGAMWLLSLSVIRLIWSALFEGRKIEVGMFSFLGAMMFAFPALRNSQPGAPALGTFSDFISFFWAEGTIALALLVLVTAFLSRPQAK